MIIQIIEKTLDAPTGSITLKSSVENTELWDSLGHLSILSALDIKFDGKIAGIDEMASANSVENIVDILKEHSVI